MEHKLGEYPIKVDVQIKVKDNGKDYVFTGLGSSHTDDDYKKSYGGVVYMYNKNDVVMTFHLKNNNYATGGIAYTGMSLFDIQNNFILV